jgi:uncharacterized protein YjdB
MRGFRFVEVACAGLLAVGSLAGCGQKPHAIEVDPASVNMFAATDKATLKAKVVDEAGKPIQDAKVTFTSDKADIATVSATGEVAAKKSGKANITVAIGEVKKQVPVNIKIYTTLKVDPENWEAKVGDMGALKGSVMDEAGQPITDAAITFASSDENVAKVDAQGKVTAVAPGEAKITATSRNLTGAATVKVAAAGPSALNAATTAFDLAVGGTAKFDVSGVDAAGGKVEGLTLTFASSDAKVATVGGDGTITAVGPGSATVTASEPTGKSITATVNVKK